MKYILIILSIKYVLFSIINCENIYDVTKFGADLKGIHKSTEAVKKAIDEAVSKGGGTVYFPDGHYICGPIHLKSNITLHLADKAIIKFSKDFDDYLPMVRMRWEGTEVINFSPLIYAFKAQNIAIKGKGILDGQGSYWWNYYHELHNEFTKNKQANSKYQKEFFQLNNLTALKSETTDSTKFDFGFFRPPFIQPFDCKNILIEDITVENSPFWNINPVYCENVNITGVTIKAPPSSPNTDGIDPDSCKNVYISKVVIDVGDDCIAIKSGRDGQGRRIGRPTENVLITDSHMLRGHSGVCIGSESSGGVRNVTVRDCIFNGTLRGLEFRSTRGRGGIIEHIEYKNITMTRIEHEAILIAMNLWWIHSNNDDPNKVVPFSEGTPVYRNIKFENIKSESLTSIGISGIRESLLDNIELKNIEMTSKYGFTANYTKSLKISGFSEKLTSK